MRILFISTSSGSRGGGEIFLLYLGQGLKQHGHDIALWTSSHESMDELCDKFKEIGGNVLRSDYVNTYRRKLRLISTNRNTHQFNLIKKQWLEWKPDLLHLNKQNLEDGLDLLNLVCSLSIPSVCLIHITQAAQYLGAKFGWLRDRLARLSLKRYQGTFLTVSNSRSQSLLFFLRQQSSRVHAHQPSVKVINNGVPQPNIQELKAFRQIYREKLNLEKQEKLFVTVGRLVDQKRPFYFLESARSILQNLPTARFIWVGDGSLRHSWEQYIAQDRLLEHKVQCLGWQDDVIPWLAAADLYLHTAQYEGLPFSVLEALSVGLPCLITEDLLTEILEFQAPGILSLEKSIDDIPQLFEPENFKYLQKNASDLFLEEFSLPIMIKRYEDLYHSCLLLNIKSELP